MKKIFFLLAVILLASCTTTRKSTPTTSMNFQINLNIDNLVYIGDATGTSTQNYVLGIPIGGRKYKAGVSNQFNLISMLHMRSYNNAMYDALMSKPDADFILPISYEETTVQMFLGSKVTLTLKTKAFKIKTK
jgi:hypothetical protein